MFSLLNIYILIIVKIRKIHNFRNSFMKTVKKVYKTTNENFMCVSKTVEILF